MKKFLVFRIICIFLYVTSIILDSVESVQVNKIGRTISVIASAILLPILIFDFINLIKKRKNDKDC